MLLAQCTEPTLPTPWAFSERLNCPNLHFQVPIVNPCSYLPGTFASVPIHQEPTSILYYFQTQKSTVGTGVSGENSDLISYGIKEKNMYRRQGKGKHQILED